MTKIRDNIDFSSRLNQLHRWKLLSHTCGDSRSLNGKRYNDNDFWVKQRKKTSRRFDRVSTVNCVIRLNIKCRHDALTHDTFIVHGNDDKQQEKRRNYNECHSNCHLQNKIMAEETTELEATGRINAEQLTLCIENNCHTNHIYRKTISTFRFLLNRPSLLYLCDCVCM